MLRITVHRLGNELFTPETLLNQFRDGRSHVINKTVLTVLAVIGNGIDGRIDCDALGVA